MLVFEERHKPVVFIVAWGEHEEADFEQYHARFRAWHASRERVLILNDPRAQAIPSAYWRRRFAELADFVAATAPSVTCANAAVIGSSLLVGAARAVSWLRTRSRDETHYCSSAMEGLQWLARRGASEKLVVPDGARELAAALDEHARSEKHPSLLFGRTGPPGPRR